MTTSQGNEDRPSLKRSFAREWRCQLPGEKSFGKKLDAWRTRRGHARPACCGTSGSDSDWNRATCVRPTRRRPSGLSSPRARGTTCARCRRCPWPGMGVSLALGWHSITPTAASTADGRVGSYSSGVPRHATYRIVTAHLHRCGDVLPLLRCARRRPSRQACCISRNPAFPDRRQRRGTNGPQGAPGPHALPDQIDGTGWEYGVPVAYMKELVAYWRTSTTGASRSGSSTSFDQFTTQIDGLDIHFVHVRSKEKNALPLVIVARLARLVRRVLQDHRPAHRPGGPRRQGRGCVPRRLPVAAGLRLLQQAERARLESQRMAEMIAKLMARLGYDALRGPRRRLGRGRHPLAGRQRRGALHRRAQQLPRRPASRRTTRCAASRRRSWSGCKPRIKELNDHRAYGAIQGTRPLTLGYGLNDSPAGLARLDRRQVLGLERPRRQPGQQLHARTSC